MKILTTIVFALSVALLVIAIHQIMIYGFANSYWILMLSTFAFLWFAYLKRNENPGEEVYEKYKILKSNKNSKTKK